MFTIREKLIHKIKVKAVPLLAASRRKKLNNTDFTIISNNCWGGICYEYFGLPKLSPTVGCYFYADDYIRFISNLPRYLNTPLEIISATESKHFESLRIKNQLDVPVGVLDDVEVILLHYKDPKVAIEKWNRRIQRINPNNIILKFSFMNECTDELFTQFTNIQGVKKIAFIGGVGTNNNGIYHLPYCSDKCVKDDTFYWNKYLDVVNIINRPATPISNLFFGG